MLRFCLLTAALVTLAALGQEQPETIPEFRTTVDVVVAPVTVLDRDGALVTGLQPRQFRLFDNGKEQDIKVDVTFQPISVVIAVQGNSSAEGVLPQIQRIGSLIQPLITGEQGEAAVLAFDHRFRLMQEFTNDASKITEAIKKVTAGSSSSRMIDAVTQSVRMLRSRPKERRRIILLISETRDRASEGRLRNALIDAQLNNVSIYTVNISRLVTTLTAQPLPPRPDPLPPAARPLPPGVAPTPNNVANATGLQGGSANFIPLMVELFRTTKALFVDNPAEAFTKGTGGTEFSFIRQRGLEDAIARIGEELHSQYLVAYTPNNKEEGGFHELTVQISGRPDLKCRTRPGYWLASVFNR